jgi:AcrR family transcriptional regulator
MSDTTAPQQPQVTGLSERPKRADARRNYEKLLTAAADAFAENGTATSLEDIARRADVGIGTLYRHFPTRQALLEAVYLDEVEEISRKANDLVDLEPWEALVTWLRQFVRYAATKRALADEMMNTMDAEAPVFVSCRTAITAAGDLLLERAQKAGVVRPDTNFTDVGRMVAGIASIRTVDPGQIDRILDVALDGLRYTAPVE